MESKNVCLYVVVENVCCAFIVLLQAAHSYVSKCHRQFRRVHGTARHGSSSRCSAGPLGQSYNRSLGARTLLRQVAMHFTTCL